MAASNMLGLVFWSVVFASALTQSWSISSDPPVTTREGTIPDTSEDMESSGDGEYLGSGSGRLWSIDSIANSAINSETVGSVINSTLSALEETPDMEVEELTQVVSIVEKATQIPSIPLQTANEVLEIVDTLSRLEVTGPDKTKRVGQFSNRLIRSVEEVGHKVNLRNTSSARLLSAHVAMEVWDISKASEEDGLPLGILLKVQEEEEEEEEGAGKRRFEEDLVTVFEDKQVEPKHTDVSVALPSSFLKGIIQDNRDKEVRLWMTVFSDTSLFTRQEEEEEERDIKTSDPHAPTEGRISRSRGRLNSKVISVSVSADGEPVSRFPPSVVTSVFRPVEEVSDDRRAQLSRCVFWDLQAREGRGAWSEEGCHHQTTLHGLDVCVCDHLTNFAVLLDFYEQSDQLDAVLHQTVLGWVTVTGMSLSICALFCTLMAFICIKKMHHMLPKQVLFNLALAMLLSWVVYLSGFKRVPGSVARCVAAAALLQYLLMCTALWMLAEGLLQYLLLVRVHRQVSHFLLKACLAAWGIPVIPVITILVVDLKTYTRHEEYCWMSGSPLHFGFMLPVGLILLCNLVIYVLVVVTICRVKARGKPGSGSSGRGKGRGVSIRASVACFIILGLNWLFAFLAVGDARLVFQYLFTITTTFQGLLIFLLFTVRDRLFQEFVRDKVRQGMALVRSSSKPTTSSSSGSRRSSAKREEAGVFVASSSGQSSGKKGGGGGGSGRGEVSSDIPLKVL
ncbi:adhesion G-protein coupled receptor G2-like [Babylonia areolata]|uniref:adhesion G-protein coupled receptor G2-like n=1 Tax=Babylonia areolata TaxID=304850 RepID=UPI003FD35286